MPKLIHFTKIRKKIDKSEILLPIFLSILFCCNEIQVETMLGDGSYGVIAHCY